MENGNVCIFSTLPGGYLPGIESLEDYQLKISTVHRDYHHPLGATPPPSPRYNIAPSPPIAVERAAPVFSLAQITGVSATFSVFSDSARAIISMKLSKSTGS